MFHRPKYPTDIHVLWIAKYYRNIYGKRYFEIISSFGDHLHLHDTRIQGRPSAKDACNLCKKLDAEAIFVVSNEPFTAQMIRYGRKYGIPVYGATFDS
jgi:hypothetical protein